LPATPETLAEYLAHLAESCRVSTLERRLTAIARAHEACGLASPAAHPGVRATLRGIRRTLAEQAPVRAAKSGKAPLSVEQLRAIVAATPDTLAGQRDRALLLLGFAAALRRSELVALDLADLEHVPEGLIITLRRSKTDQEGAGRRIGVPYGGSSQTCPVAAARDWITSANLDRGPLFRRVDRHGNVGGRLSDRSVALIVKAGATRVGIDPARVAGHSLRAGLATAAARAGKSERSIALQTGHSSLRVLRGYIREGTLFRDNAAAGIGL
jgi:integrase